MAISIDLVKSHLNIDDNRDAQLLQHYASVAENWISGYVGYAFDSANPLMIQAALLLISHQYESREGVVFSNPMQLPFGVHDMLSSLKERVTGYTSEDENV